MLALFTPSAFEVPFHFLQNEFKYKSAKTCRVVSRLSTRTRTNATAGKFTSEAFSIYLKASICDLNCIATKPLGEIEPIPEVPS